MRGEEASKTLSSGTSGGAVITSAEFGGLVEMCGVLAEGKTLEGHVGKVLGLSPALG